MLLLLMTSVNSHASVLLMTLLSPNVICAFCLILLGFGFSFSTNLRSTKSIEAPLSSSARPLSFATLTLKIICELSSTAGAPPAAAPSCAWGASGRHSWQYSVILPSCLRHGIGVNHLLQSPHLRGGCLPSCRKTDGGCVACRVGRPALPPVGCHGPSGCPAV